MDTVRNFFLPPPHPGFLWYDFDFGSDRNVYSRDSFVTATADVTPRARLGNEVEQTREMFRWLRETLASLFSARRPRCLVLNWTCPRPATFNTRPAEQRVSFFVYVSFSFKGKPKRIVQWLEANTPIEYRSSNELVIGAHNLSQQVYQRFS